MFRIIVPILILLILILLWSYAGGVFKSASSALTRPLWKVGLGISSFWSGFTAGLRAKSALESENGALKEEIAELKFNLTGFADISEENVQLKEILGRVGSREVVLAVVLAKPGHSPYDTLVIDIGSQDGVAVGAHVFASGDVLIGDINKVMPKSSIIRLFSSPGEKSDIVLPEHDLYLQAVGLGGGSFKISAPRDLEIIEGAELLLPGFERQILAVVEKIISDPRDPIKTILATSPVNVQHLRWVEVER